MGAGYGSNRVITNAVKRFLVLIELYVKGGDDIGLQFILVSKVSYLCSLNFWLKTLRISMKSRLVCTK